MVRPRCCSDHGIHVVVYAMLSFVCSPSSAAFVTVDSSRVVQLAPGGKSKSDVLAQTFLPAKVRIRLASISLVALIVFLMFSVSTPILNGTRNGSTWLWDTRAPRRAYECALEVAGGAMVDLKVLSNGVHVVAQRTSGHTSSRSQNPQSRDGIYMWRARHVHVHSQVRHRK